MNALYKIAKSKVHVYFNRLPVVFSRNSHWSEYSYLYGASNNSLKPHMIGGIFNDVVRQNPDQEYLVSKHENKRYTYAAMDFEVTINPAYQSDELKHSLTLVGVKCLVTMETFKTQNYPALIEQIDPEIWRQPPNTPIKSKILPMLETVVFNSENRINGAYNLKSFLDLGSSKNYSIPNVQPDDVCNIQFTSGTTGKPKAALLNHFSMINNIYYTIKRLGIYDYNVRHKFCCPMPLFHIFGLSASILAPILTNSAAYLPSAHFEPKATVDVIIKEKCTFFFGTPTMYLDVMSIFYNLPSEQRKNDVILAIIGGAPSSPDLMKKLKTLFLDAKFTSVFGMTETSPNTFQNLPDDTDERI